MEKREALVILAMLHANWGQVELTDATRVVWADHLRDIPPASGLAAANELIATSPHFPTVWEFRGAWRAHQRRDALKTAEVRKELPAVVVPATVHRKWIAEMRESLKKAAS